MAHNIHNVVGFIMYRSIFQIVLKSSIRLMVLVVETNLIDVFDETCDYSIRKVNGLPEWLKNHYDTFVKIYICHLKSC